MAIQAIYRGNIAQCQDILAQARRVQKASEDAATTSLCATRKSAAAHIRSLRQRARAAGFKAGASAAQADMFAKILELNEKYKRNLRQANRDCLEIALGIAKQIIGDEISEKSGLLAKRIEQAIEGLALRSKITVAINSKDSAREAYSLEALKQKYLFDCIVKETIIEGAFVIKSSEGSVTIDWRDHFDSIEQALRTTLAHLVKSEPNNA
jgi:flagellar biosynthesis/type III secretory pathway protein FliH